MNVQPYDLATQQRRLANVYIGVVGSEDENGRCRESIENLNIRPGDSRPKFLRATKGYEARNTHFEAWLSQPQYGAMFLMDHDMVFAQDSLERLRGHGLPFVSGLYMRRMYSPIAPVWYEYPEGANEWPLMPFMQDPQRGVLHRLGASGWGCILIHREVAEAVRPLMKDEWWVIEDDMDVWPYDLQAVMDAIRGLGKLARKKADVSPSDIKPFADALSEQMRPLRGFCDPVGSDLRFPWFARRAGYDLWGDPDVRPGHNLNYPLSPDDYASAVATQAEITANLAKSVQDGRQTINTLLASLRGEA